MKVKVPSDHFFNHPEEMSRMRSMGMDVYPIDVMGADVPEGKSLDNLKKQEACIQHRFGLKAGGGE